MANNILYVTVDSIRADRTGFSGYERPTTPNLDQIAQRGTVWTTAIASGIPTYYSFKSLLCGLHSLSHSRDIGVPAEATTLAEAFRQLGYETAGFNAGNPWLRAAYGYDRGFETFRDFLTEDDESGFTSRLDQLTRQAQSLLDGTEFLQDKLGQAARTAFAVAGHTPLEPAEEITDRAVEWLSDHADSDRPFFLWIHYMDPHYPWVPREQDLRAVGSSPVSNFEKGRLWHQVAHHGDDGADKRTDQTVSPSALNRIDCLYDAEVRRTDAAIGRLTTALRSLGVFKDTVLAVTGDHGTELHDHGGFSHGPRSLYDEVTRVPLVLAGPGVPDDERHPPTSLVGVPETLLDRSGADPPDELLGRFEGGGEGDSEGDGREDGGGNGLFSDDDAPVVSEVVYDFDPVSGRNLDNDLLVACYDWPWKLIQNRELGTTELYHLEDDPDEWDDRSDREPRQADKLREHIARHRDEIERRNRTVEERRRVRRRLADLEREGRL